MGRIFIIAVLITSCGAFDDFGSLSPPGDASTDTDTDTDADTDTDTDTDTDSDTETDTDTCDPGPNCDDLDWECDTGYNECGDFLTCPDCPTAQWCDDHTCEPCNDNLHCGDLCVECTITEPLCDTILGECVECLTDAHCQPGGVSPFISPLGICAPDGMCTCYVNGSETWQCTSVSECPTGYQCAQDLPGNIHFVCLRDCSPTGIPADGITCENRITSTGNADVWAPMTTCFAFDMFGEDCSGDGTICSVDGSGGLADGYCVDATDCSYP